MPQGTRALRKAREVLSRVDLVRINGKVLSQAAAMETGGLRTLEAIQLATAGLFGRSLRRFVCCDGRLADAARLVTGSSSHLVERAPGAGPRARRPPSGGQLCKQFQFGGLQGFERGHGVGGAAGSGGGAQVHEGERIPALGERG